MQSIVSYPDRGPWGKSSWRGNTSGHIIVDLIDHFKPELFCDVCEGSGTSGDVCKSKGVSYVGLDLYKGQDFTRDSVLAALPRPADVVFSHFPYYDMVKYSGSVYGNEILEGDTSHCDSPEEFIAKSQVALLNQREACKQGGIYTTLIGDHRSKGAFRSYQSDFISMMPQRELLSVVIKAQHNCVSDRKNYSGASFIPIQHEYLLIWQKKARTLMQVSFDIAMEHQKAVATTWRNAIRIAMMNLGGKATLSQIYEQVEIAAAGLIRKNQHYRAKIRQTLQKHYTNVERGVWAVKVAA
jgi:hypothetical protein